MVFSSKTSISIAVILLVAAAGFFLYAMYDYTNSGCYADMHKAGLDQETAELLETLGDVATGLRKGTADTPKWDNPEFQNEVKDALHVLAEGRRALKERDAFAALKSVPRFEKPMARAKSMATDRVNHILQVQDPADYDAFEKYRLEGKKLVEIVKRIDAAFEAANNRSRKLPAMCDW